MATQDLPSKGMKAVLIQHVEKIVFGLVCLICLALVAMSWMKDRGDVGQPSELSNSITQASVNIEDETWDQANRDEDLSANLEEINSSEDDKINYAWYSYDMPWHMPHFPPSAKRSDPVLYPVQDLLVTGQGHCAIAKADPDAEGSRPEPGRDRGRGGGLDRFSTDDDEEDDGPRQIDTYVQSMIPGFSGGSGDGVRAEGVYFVAVTGVVPNALQYDAYEDAFALATGYQPTRDTPRYLTWVVQRADVTADPYGPVPEDAWKRIMHNAQYRGQAAGSEGNDGGKPRWAENMTEVIDSNYEDDVLTAPIPPIMLRDVSATAGHPEVPLSNVDPEEEEEEVILEEEEEAEEEEDADDPLFGDGSRDDADADSDARDSRLRGNEIDPADIEYKLFRFYDLTVEPGHAYRYRVILYLEDPNNPREEGEAPAEASLTDEVAQRIRANRDQHHRMTDPSEPTEPVMIRPGIQVVAGPVGEPELKGVRGDSRTYPAPLDEEQEADILVIVWDPEVTDVDDRTLPVDAMAVKQARRGEVLFFTQTIDVLDPTTREFVRVEDYEFELEKVVLDMAGSEELPGIPRDRSDTPLSGGQVLLMDEFGNLEVHDSLLQENEYRALQYLAEELLEDDDADADLDGRRGGGALDGVRTEPSRRSSLDD